MTFFDRHLWWIQSFNLIAGVISFLFLFGVLKTLPGYFVALNVAMKCFLALWLIYRFGISQKITLTAFDLHAGVVAGVYILLSSLTEYVLYFVKFKDLLRRTKTSEIVGV
jgi:hypothetical protein